MNQEKIKVLFVEDDIELGNVVSSFLKKRDIEVHFQSTLAGAKGALKELRPDIVVLDIEIGEDNGLEAIPAIKDIMPLVPIIIASSHIDCKNLQAAIQAGASDYINKPYVPDMLELFIRKNLIEHSFHIIKIGGLGLNTHTRVLEYNGKELKRLSNLEYKLLKLLANNANDIVLREDIIKDLWVNENASTEFALNNLINALRRIIPSGTGIEIITERGRGFGLISK